MSGIHARIRHAAFSTILLLCVSGSAGANGEGAWGKWQDAGQLYQAGKYEEALKAFEAAPEENASYYYNVGLTLAKLGRLGPAVAYVEKAHALAPSLDPIETDLALLKSKLAETFGGADHLDPASSAFESAAGALPRRELQAAFGLLLFITGFITLRTYARTRQATKLLQPPILVSSAITLALGAAVALQSLSASSPAAVLKEKAAIRSGPADKFVELAQLDPGVRIRLTGPTTKESGESWMQVRYARSGELGWVRASSLLLL